MTTKKSEMKVVPGPHLLNAREQGEGPGAGGSGDRGGVEVGEEGCRCGGRSLRLSNLAWLQDRMEGVSG